MKKNKTVEYGKYGLLFLIPFFLVFLVFQLYPLLYTFYNSFYCDFMNALENKKEEILKYGEISLFKQECTALTLVDQSKDAFGFISTFIRKIKKL